MKILAIDPGATTGYAHSAGPHGIWTFAGFPHAGGAASALIDAILAFAANYPVDSIISEGGYAQSRRGAQALEAMRAAVQIAAYRLGCVPVRIVAPSTLKLYWAGHGHAEKSQMIRATIDRTGIVPATDDEADAIAMLHMARCNQPADRTAGPPRKAKGTAKPKTSKPAAVTRRRIITDLQTPPF